MYILLYIAIYIEHFYTTLCFGSSLVFVRYYNMYIIFWPRHVVFGCRQLAKRQEKLPKVHRHLVRTSTVAEPHDLDDCVQQIQEQSPGAGKHRQLFDKFAKVHSEYYSDPN